MPKSWVQSLGGRAKAVKIRSKYIPKLCLYCQRPILPDHKVLSATRQKKFCNQSCAASHNNHYFPKRGRNITTTLCSKCGAQTEYRRKFCRNCRMKSCNHKKSDPDPRRRKLYNHSGYVMNGKP